MVNLVVVSNHASLSEKSFFLCVAKEKSLPSQLILLSSMWATVRLLERVYCVRLYTLLYM